MNENTISIKEKLYKFAIGIFLFILISMLIVLLLPGDIDQNFFDLISGKTKLSAGKIGGESIPFHYFQASRRDCYYRYKQYAPSMAENKDTIDTCAYYTIRNLIISKKIADSLGFTVTEKSIHQELSDQAREIYKESITSPGYTEEDVNSVENIYKQILKVVPMQYRVDSEVSSKLYSNFLQTEITPSLDEQRIMKESEDIQIDLRLVYYTDSKLYAYIDESSITVSKDEIKQRYESEKKENKLSKGPDGKILTLEKRETFLKRKIELEKKQKLLEDVKIKISKMKNNPNGFDEIAKFLNEKTIPLTKSSLTGLSEIKIPTGNLKLGSNNDFLKDLKSNTWKDKTIGGPYKDGDKFIFVEFSNIELKSSKITNSLNSTNSYPKNLAQNFLMEIHESYLNKYPIKRTEEESIE